MNYKLLITWIFALSSLTNVAGQGRLFVEHKNKPTRKKYLDLNRAYDIKTNDTTYLYKKIIGFNDTSISITTLNKTGKDSTYTLSYTTETKNLTHTYTRPLYREDTVVILFKNIRYLKKDWFENRKWLEPFGWLAAGAVMGVALLPVAAIDEGKKGVRGWAIFEGILVGIAGPPIFVGTRKTKYDLKKKWVLKVER